MNRINIMKIEYIAFSAVVWCTFNESFSGFNISLGVLLGVLFFKISERFLGNHGVEEGNHRNFSLILYILRLMLEIYINTVSLILLLIKGRLDPTLVKVRTKGRGRVVSLIANSITLTPKTSCIHKEGEILTILCAHEMSRGEIVDGFEIKTLEEEDLIPSMEFLRGDDL